MSPASDTIRLTVRDGLGARVCALANALSSGAGQVIFGWQENEHCPLSHRQVFPEGIAGISFADPGPESGFTDWNGQPYFCWHGATDRALANAAYGRIMAAMAGTPSARQPLAIHARFHRRPTASPIALADTAARAAHDRGIREIFLLSDAHRLTIAARLLTHGITVHLPLSPELPTDLARPPAEQIAFLDDWKTLLASPVIVSLDGPTALLHPARAAGAEIIYAPLQAPCAAPA
jgi:hypothetical protein